jgi:tol-pal system protein YbgF
MPTGKAAPTPASDESAAAYAAAFDYIKKSDFPGAETAFRAFLASYPGDPKAPDARYYLGQTLLQRGAPSDAAEQFLAIVKKTPKAERAPEAMVRLGVSLNRMGEKAQACATLQALPTQFPKAAPGVKASAVAQIKAIGC